jgi:hypothetical protein
MSKANVEFGKIWRKVFPKIASDLDLGRYVKDNCLPESLPNQQGDWDKVELKGNIDFNLNLQAQIEFLEQVNNEYFKGLFRKIQEDLRINQNKTLNVVSNNYFNTPDAEIYAAVIALFKPEKIIEIGAGFSTRIARTTIEFSQLQTKIVVIDPNPRTGIYDVADEVINSKIESINFEDLNFSEKTILFIDSSHICKSRGDIPYIYGPLLKNIPVNTLVHIHDIYIPFDYPTVYDTWLWNEQYLLSTILMHSRNFETFLSVHALCREREQNMKAIINSEIDSGKNMFCGGSFYIKKVSFF